MTGPQMIGLAFSIPVLLSVAVDGLAPMLMRRPRRTPPLSGTEVLLLVEMAAALGWFFWNFHASFDARQMASFPSIVTGMQLQIAFRHRQSGRPPSYVLPVVALLLAVGIGLVMQGRPVLEGIGAAVLVAAAVWDIRSVALPVSPPTTRAHD